MNIFYAFKTLRNLFKIEASPEVPSGILPKVIKEFLRKFLQLPNIIPLEVLTQKVRTELPPEVP